MSAESTSSGESARFDPLEAVRARESKHPDVDVFAWGTVFLDMIFAGFAQPPAPGTEVFADGMASCPGGVANLAVATSRLGLRTSLASPFSDDDYGDFCFRTLSEGEGIDLSKSQRFADWHSPVTVSISIGGDRQMITHAHDSPISANAMIATPPTARAVMVNLVDKHAATVEGDSWVDKMRAAGSLIFADAGWDPAGEWSPDVLGELDGCFAYMPNALEATAYTNTDSAQTALYALADRVPLAVVTNGANGAIAIDSSTGEEASVPAVRVDQLDPTGAGDVFGAAIMTGTLAGWSLRDRLSFASLCAGLALQGYGGSLAAPTWGDVIDWWDTIKSCQCGSAYHQSLLRRFEFLDSFEDRVGHATARRATATIARRADVPGL